MFVSKFLKWVLGSVVVVVLTACGGGGSAGDDNTNASTNPDGSEVSTNVLPKAMAGEDMLINPDDNVTLDASESVDTDGQIVSYEWKDDKNITVSTSKACKLTALSLGQHRYNLTVTDNDGAIASDNTTITVTSNKMILQDNVVVLADDTEENIVSIVGELGKDGNITFKNSDNIKDWGTGDIKILQPSNAIPQGMALKIISKQTNINGELVIEYIVPTIDEVFKDSRVEVKSNLTTNMITKTKMNKYANISFEQESKTTGRLEKWFPSPPSVTPTVTGEGDNLIKKIKVELDVPLYENNVSNTIREFANLKAGFEITDFSLDYLFENHIIDNISDLKKPTMVNKLDLKYNMKKTVDLEISASFKASLAKQMKDSMFECGLTAKLSDNDYVSVELTSSGFDKNDICLGSVSIELSPAVVKASVGNIKTEAPAALKLFFILGADLDIKVVSKISLEHNSYIHTGAYFDTTKDLDKIFDAYHTEQVSSSDASQPQWSSSITGEMAGSATFYQGIAFTPQIMNMYPFVLSATAGPKMEGKVTASYSSDENQESGFCAEVDLKIDYGFYARTSNKFDVNVTHAGTRKWITEGFDISFNYEWKTDYDNLDLYKYDSCKNEDYSLEFNYLPVESSDFILSNIQVLDKDNNPVVPDSIRYLIYQNGVLISSGSSTDIFKPLTYGSYVVEAIVDIDSENAIRSTLQINYRVNTPPVADIGDNREGVIGTTINIDASNSYDIDGDITIFTFTVDGTVKQIGESNIFALNLNALDDHNVTLKTTDNDGAISEASIIITVTDISNIPSTLSAPTNLKIISTDKSINLKWDKITDVSAYEICMSASTITDDSQCVENGAKLIGVTSTTKTISEGLQKDTTYYFRVRGVNNGSKALWGDEVNIKLITIVEDSLTLTIESSDIKTGTAYVHISSSIINSGTITFYDNGQVRDLDDGTTENGYVSLTSGKHIIQVCSTNDEGIKCSEEEIIIVAETVDISLYSTLPLEASSNAITNDGTSIMYGTTGGKLYSLDITTKESTYLVDLDERVSGLFYDKETSFYYYSSISSGNIYRVSLQDNTRTTLYRVSFPDGLDYYKNNLYTVTNDRSGILTIINTKGEKQGTLDTGIDDIVGISHTDKFLYILSEDGHIYQTNNSTGKSIKIFSNAGLFEQGNTNAGLEGITVLNSRIYVSYVNDSSIYLINVNLEDYE